MIVFFNSNRNWSGKEKWHFDVAHGLINLGYKVVVISHPGGELLNRCRKSGIPAKGLRIGWFSVLNIFKILYLVFFIYRNKVSCFFVDNTYDFRFVGLASLFSKTIKIIFRRGMAQPLNNHIINKLFFKLVKSEFLTSSFETKNVLLKSNNWLFKNAIIHVVYNGIDLYEFDHREFKPLYEAASDEIVIGNAGLFIPHKAHYLLIDLAVLLKKQNLNFKILIAGQGEMEQKLKQMAKQKGVDEQVLFMGFIDNIKSFMRSIDIFVMPSLREGFGYSIIEAMASGLPVVAFNTSSNPEICGEGQFLAEPYDLNQLMWYVKQLALDSDLRKKHGNIARERVETHFTIEPVLRQIAEIAFVKH